MVRPFDKVLTRKPSKSLKNCVSPYINRYPLDFDKASDQYRSLIKILKSVGIEIIELEPLHAYPDSVFVQDAAVIGNKSRTAALSYFGEPSRRGEEEALADVLKGEGLSIKKIVPPGTLEGGDVLVTDRNLVFLGETKRTNREGISQLMKIFSSVSYTIVPSDKFIHMPAGVRYLEDGLLVVAAGAADPKYFKGFEILELKEDLSPIKSAGPVRAYLMYIGNRQVILPPNNEKTAEALKAKGYTSITLDFTEFWKCNGSYMCLIQPFYNYL